jgi:hypothetical protein
MPKADRETWQAEVARQAVDQYGIELVGPDIPAFLDQAYAKGVRPLRAVSDLADRFKLELLPSRRPGGMRP